MSWHTDTAWFDLTIIMTIFALGNIAMGHFEMHKPLWARFLKVLIVSTVFVAISQHFGRQWALLLVALLLSAALYIHLVWLPRNGVNGWTGEPRDRYLELIGANRVDETRSKA